jgi:hypothetical protein
VFKVNGGIQYILWICSKHHKERKKERKRERERERKEGKREEEFDVARALE